jgi:8-oxo-dGTP pyrophosphatase MutT (NUDIX family)
MEQNETPDDALRREFKEEINLDVKILNESDIPFEGNIKRNLATPFYANVHNVGDHDHCCLFYVCTADEIGGLEANLNELEGLAWFSKEDLDQSHVPKDVRNIALKAFQIYHSL